jgi:HAMP domain-containing protein
MSVLILAAPALPLHAAGKYVAGAYIVFVALILVYVAIMARRLARSQRELAELRREADEHAARHVPADGVGGSREQRDQEPVA